MRVCSKEQHKRGKKVHVGSEDGAGTGQTGEGKSSADKGRQ